MLEKNINCWELTQSTYHFVFDRFMLEKDWPLLFDRPLFLALVRSNVAHWSNVRHLVYDTDSCKFEILQKQAIK